MQADLDGCTREALRAPEQQYRSQQYYGQNLLAGAIVQAAVETARRQKAKDVFVGRCMRTAGYFRVRITPEESKSLSALKTSNEKGAWAQALYDRPDFQQRLEDAEKSPVLALPPAKDEILTYEGLRFDPQKLTPGSGVIKKGGEVLSGSVSHRQTARLSEDFSFSGSLMGGTAKKGDIFYQAILDGPDGSNQSFWCGEIPVKDFIRTHPEEECFGNDEDGYIAIMVDGQNWHLSRIPDVNHVEFSDARISLDLSPDDLIGPMAFSIVVSNIDQESISYRAILKKDDDSESIWTRKVPFDAAGKAVLPFWDHRLVATRSGDGVSVLFSADGDGKSWNDKPAP